MKDNKWEIELDKKIVDYLFSTNLRWSAFHSKMMAGIPTPSKEFDEYKKAVDGIKSLLKKQRKKQVKEVGTLLVVDVEQEIKPYDAQLIMEMKANHNEMVRKYNLAVVKVLSILKGNKE